MKLLTRGALESQKTEINELNAKVAILLLIGESEGSELLKGLKHLRIVIVGYKCLLLHR